MRAFTPWKMMNENVIVAYLQAQRWGTNALAQQLGVNAEEMAKYLQPLRAEGVVIGNDREGYTLASTIEWLSVDAIIQALEPQVRLTIDPLQVAWSVDSTNTCLLRADVDPEHARVLLAERQTAGRGRRGRPWVSPAGANLYLSLLREFPAGWAALGGLSLAVGVAVAQALEDEGFANIALKWPNDLQIDDRKLGGILIEGGGERQGRARAVIGIGLNVAMPETEAARIDQPWTDLAQAGGTRVSRNLLAAALLNRLVPALDVFAREGLAPFLEGYAQRDVLRGCMVMVEDGHNTLWQAVAVGIAADGALRLQSDAGEQCLHAGEVRVRAR